MSRKFIQINESRIDSVSIKKYRPEGESKLIIYYNTSRYKVEMESFNFATRFLRDEFLVKLDNLFRV